MFSEDAHRTVGDIARSHGTDATIAIGALTSPAWVHWLDVSSQHIVWWGGALLMIWRLIGVWIDARDRRRAVLVEIARMLSRRQ